MTRSAELAFETNSYEEYCRAYDAQHPAKFDKKEVNPERKVKIVYPDGENVVVNANSLTIKDCMDLYNSGAYIDLM